MAPEYSHESTIHAITSYYTFLTNLYLPPSTIIYPPPQGWPSITPESLAPLNKNSTVLQLLQHLPYFAQLGGDKVVLAQGTWPVPYYDPNFQTQIQNAAQREYLVEPVYETTLPEYAVCLAKGTRDGYYIILDTSRGVIVWGKPAEPWGNKSNDLTPNDIDPEGPERWKRSATFEVPDFFEMLKGKFRRMEWIPHPSGATDVYEVDEQVEESESCGVLKGIFRDAGWPGDGEGGGWDRKGADEKIVELMDELDDL
ncbi:hypothetical protein BGZ60DRAFT_569495 [Tricladium varicosporioides]|nr:hypothetical protein BGZ60DRAFT_569495 [Hymenoscyphus varicosporioides]